MLPCHLYIILSEISVHLLFSNWIFGILLLNFESYILDPSLWLDTQLADNCSQFTVCLFILLIETFTEKRIDFSLFLLWIVILMSSVRTHCLALEPNPGFPRWHSGKESAFQFRRHKGSSFDTWVRKIHWRRKWQPTPVLLPGESYGQRNLAGYSPWGRKSRTRLSDFHYFTTMRFERCINFLVKSNFLGFYQTCAKVIAVLHC